MIVVKVELWPHGDQKRSKSLGSMIVANDAKHSDRPVWGSYVFRITDRIGRRWRRGHVLNFPRKRLLVWDLLYRALHEAVGYRNQP